MIFDLLGVGVELAFAFVELGLGVGFNIFDSKHLCCLHEPNYSIHLHSPVGASGKFFEIKVSECRQT